MSMNRIEYGETAREYGPVLRRRLLAMMVLVATLALPATVGRAAQAPLPIAPDRLAAEFGNGIRVTVLDATGRNPIKEFQVIAGVRSHAGGWKAKEVVNWQPHTLRQGRDGGLVWLLNRAYDEMALRVEADGYAPQVLAWLRKSQGPQDVVFELVADKGTTGRALTPDGNPAAGATVALAMVQRDAVIDNGVLWHTDKPAPERPSDRWRWPRLVQADAQGRFQLPPESDPTAAVLIVHESGVRELALADFKQQPELALQPWGRIEGKVQWGTMVDSNRTVTLSIHRDTYGYPGVIVQSGKTTSAGDGTFLFERVLPGLAQISCPLAATPGNQSGICEVNLLAQSTHLTVQPGANRALLGGQGRTIRGRLVGRADWANVSFHFHPTAPHIGLPGDDEMWKGWSSLQKSPVGPLFFRTGLKVDHDGTFEVSEVLPGDYQIFFTRAGEPAYAAGGKFVVPPETPGVKPDPQEIGEFRSQNGPASRFWEQVRSGEVRNLMLHGFKVGIRPDSYWPVAANVYVPTARLEDAKQGAAKLEPIIAARLIGLEKEDIRQQDRCARLEDDILADARSRLPELSVQKVLLSLDIQ